MGKAAAKRPAAKGRARAKGKARPSGEPKCPKCRRGCWVGGCWEVAAGGCCWSVPPRQEGVPHATACGKARSGVTPPCVPVASFRLSLQAGRVVGGGGGGEVAEAGPTETLDPMPGVPQEEVAGGGVGLGRSGWVGRRREVGPGLSIPRKRQDGRTRNRWCKRLPSSRKPLCLPRRPCHPRAQFAPQLAAAV